MRFAEQWTSCLLTGVRDVAPEIREITLRPDAPLPLAAPGSHVTVSLLIDGQPQTRCYSLVGEPDRSTLRIAVRLAPDSRGGSRAMWALQLGARVRIAGPTTLLEVDWSRRNYCLIAGGIGVTPITSIAAALARRDCNLALHYAVRSRVHAAYHNELTDMLGDRLHTYASDEARRLDLDATFAALPGDALAVICGPMRLLEAARQAWNASGRKPADLRFETFGSSGLLPTTEFRVRLKGTDTEIAVPQHRSMLDSLNDAGFDVISDCQRGECGVCAIDVLDVEGEIDHRDVFFSEQQRKTNAKICPCVSRVNGTVTVDTLYRADT